MKATKLAVIVGNRDFFPDKLVTEARQDIQAVFAEMGIEAVMLAEEDTKLGGVETWDDAKKCAALFKAHADEIDGILVLLPNFGDEKGVADTVKLSGLHVPILVQAYPDDLSQFNIERRRDSFCGKVSVCNNLRQYGFQYTLTEEHTSHPSSEAFKQDLTRFLGICRVVKGLRNARLGAIGARPGAFNTVRYSEKLLQAYGISVTTVDLSEILGEAFKLKDDEKKVKDKLAEIDAYARHDLVPSESMLRMAKLGSVISHWMTENDLNASALQCWTSVQKNFGVNVCTLMSMMSDELMPSACETDIAGTVSMYALTLASHKPAALVDWNNNYDDDPNKCIYFHCGNWAKSLVKDIRISTAEVLGTTLGPENTWGALDGRSPAFPLTYARIDTDDRKGVIKAYYGEGRTTNDPLSRIPGNSAVVEVENLQGLMRYVAKNGFAHHCAMTDAHVADILQEVLDDYLGWQVYYHQM